MHGLTGDFYGIDLSVIIKEELKGSILKYNLQPLADTGWYSTYFSNGKCIIRFWISDRRTVKWNFYEPNENLKYTITNYLKYVKGVKRPPFNLKFEAINNMDDLIRSLISNFDRELLDHLETPMSGDFSWHNTYIAGLKIFLKYAEFASSTKKHHSEERRKLAHMFFSARKGSEKAIDVYFAKHYPDGGKEFEVDDLFMT